jgi:hypothetical protein
MTHDEVFENIVDLVERHIQAQCRVAVNHGRVPRQVAEAIGAHGRGGFRVWWRKLTG